METLKDKLEGEILKNLPFKPYKQQEILIHQLAEYCTGYRPGDVYLLNGYAGSGKTSIIGALIKALAVIGKKSVTLAPTGRAAKVASGFSGGKASTIHRRIFRSDSPEPMSGVKLAHNFSTETIFIVDEASLITDAKLSSQSLLAQLIWYVYKGRDNTMILLGDIAQLPPVGQTGAPAMNTDRLKQLGLTPFTYTLDITARQSVGSGILFNATSTRMQLFKETRNEARPPLLLSPFDDIKAIPAAELADELSTSWATVGIDETIIITRSNKRANRFNSEIRNRVMMAEEPLQQGDRLVISKNDYYWSKINKLPNLLANGDTATVIWVGSAEKAYGRYFCDIELEIGQEPLRIGAKLMMRSLMTEGPSVDRGEMEKFYTLVLSRQEGTMTEQIHKALEDPYYNALQAKYGYCVTCHKAQGGQWKHVYIDMSGIDPADIDENYFRWFYTALTRATEKVFLINPPFRCE